MEDIAPDSTRQGDYPPPAPKKRRRGCLIALIVVVVLAIVCCICSMLALYLYAWSQPVEDQSASDWTVIIQGVATTTVHVRLVQNALQIPQIDTQIPGYTRTVIFDPPLPAGGLGLVDATAPTQTVVGDFVATARIQSDDQLLDLNQKGTYSATIRIRPIPDTSADIRQWAAGAIASSERQSGDWAAIGAAGPLNSFRNDGIHTAWVPELGSGEPASIELTYAQAVVPSSVDVWKMISTTLVTKLEAYDVAAQQWATLWETAAISDQAGELFNPPLTGASFATDRLRITISTEGLQPGFDLNGINAVELIGRPESAPWVSLIEGEWLENGTSEICDADGCQVIPWTEQPPRQWYVFVNRATGALGATPESVR